MVIIPENLLRHELIGLNVEVLKSTDLSQEGLTGQVIGETKNTLTLRTSKGERTVQKKGTVFKVFLKGVEVEVDGTQLVKPPEERTKTMVKKW